MKSYLIPFVLLMFGLTCHAQSNQIITVNGNWNYRFDKNDLGISEEWYKKAVSPEGQVLLPGTTDTRGIGPVNTENSEFHLNRAYKYRGAVWFETMVTIPTSWKNRAVSLDLERVQWESRVWIDGIYAGMQESLSVPHTYDLTALLVPGRHRITIRVDNRLKYLIHHSLSDWEFTHAITDETQGNWNGIIGRMDLVAKPLIAIENIQVTVSDDCLKTTALVTVSNHTGKDVSLDLEGSVAPGGRNNVTTTISAGKGMSSHRIELPVSENAVRWDEFSPVMQIVHVSLKNKKKEIDRDSARFGLMSFKSDERHFILNGRKIFLRGNLECAIWPLTGHPPMDAEEGWTKLMATIKEYGMNHLRFHSWCPPEAAFRAADEAGVIFHVELPLWDGWGNMASDSARCRFLREEAIRILKAYGNHPSFRLLSMGNELGNTDDSYLINLVRDLKTLDPGRFYTSTTHPMFLSSSDDYFVAAASPRGAIRGHLIRENESPGFNENYSDNMAGIDRPVIVHEIGQYSMFFNPDEIKKYTGCMKPRNLEIMRDAMTKNGLIDMAEPFRRSSALFQLSLYKRELEQMLATPELAGYQALGLQDFSGQGTTMCGVLDAFWESKGIVPASSWRQFCSPTVLLARFNKAVLCRSDTFRAAIQVAHFGGSDITNANVRWEILNGSVSVASGTFTREIIPTGSVTNLGLMEQALSVVSGMPVHLTLKVSIENTEFVNTWNLWVYPDENVPRKPANIFLADKWDENCKEILSKGGSVVLNPKKGSLEKGIPAQWLPVAWNMLLFPGQPSTIGIYLDTSLPLFSEFPTESHSDIQWQQLFDGGIQGVNLTGTDIKPIVWLIDDFHSSFQRKIGAVFEARVGKGRLLVVTFDISSEKQDRPEVRQFVKSLYDYVGSEKFNPVGIINPTELDSILQAVSQ